MWLQDKAVKKKWTISISTADAVKSFTHSSSTVYWEEVQSEDGSNNHKSRRDLSSFPVRGTALYFSIIDFALDWTYVGHWVVK
ncbi:hypothetical protein YC2023_010605 [Brassica napus]